VLIAESLMKPIEPHWAGPFIGRDFIGLAYCKRELEFAAAWIDGKEREAGNGACSDTWAYCLSRLLRHRRCHQAVPPSYPRHTAENQSSRMRSPLCLSTHPCSFHLNLNEK
jgi:hypothetical protein